MRPRLLCCALCVARQLYPCTDAVARSIAQPLNAMSAIHRHVYRICVASTHIMHSSPSIFHSCSIATLWYTFNTSWRTRASLFSTVYLLCRVAVVHCYCNTLYWLYTPTRRRLRHSDLSAFSLLYCSARCDAMRCDAMRCDAMRCDATDTQCDSKCRYAT